MRIESFEEIQWSGTLKPLPPYDLRRLRPPPPTPSPPPTTPKEAKRLVRDAIKAIRRSLHGLRCSACGNRF